MARHREVRRVRSAARDEQIRPWGADVAHHRYPPQRARPRPAALPLLYRYSGAEKAEATFVACAFWAAEAVACVGCPTEASTLMSELVALANDVGLYTETIDERDDLFLGNTPPAQPFSEILRPAVVYRLRFAHGPMAGTIRRLGLAR